MFNLAWQNMIRRKNQTIIIVFITALTIATFVLAQAVLANLQEGLRLSAARLGADILVLPHTVESKVSQTIFTGEPVNLYMPDSILNAVSQVDGVQAITPQFFTQTLNSSCCSLDKPYRVVGYDPATDFVISSLVSTYNKEKASGWDEAIVGAQVDSFLGGRAVILDNVFYESGRLEATGSGMDETIFIPIDTARHIAENSPYLKYLWEDSSPAHLISSILIKVSDGADPGEVADKINKIGLSANAVAANQVISNAKTQMNALGSILFFLWIALALTAALALIGSFTALARQRKRELGMLRAIGGQRNDVLFVLILEAIFLVGAGGLIGSLVGVLLTQPALNWLNRILNLPIGEWSFTSAVIHFLVGIGVALLLGAVSVSYPAGRSACRDPQEIISHGELE